MKNTFFNRLSIIAIVIIVNFSCGKDADNTRKSVIIDPAREVTLDGNSGKRFDILTSKSTGINFVNDLHDTYMLNHWRYVYSLQGGGVCIGDINKDGLPVIFGGG